MNTRTRHVGDYNHAAASINDVSGDWIDAGEVQRAHQHGKTLEYFDGNGDIAKRVSIVDTPPGTTVAGHSLDGSALKLQIKTEMLTPDLTVARNSKRATRS